MKKKIGILALVLAILMCFFTVSAFAAGDENGNSQMPFADSDQIFPEHPEIQTEDELMEEFEKMFGGSGKKLIFLAIASAISFALFLPSLIVVIVFGILNSKTKKKVKEYERYFGPVPQNTPGYYNPNIYNNPYGAPPVNPMGAPMGNVPAGEQNIPQNDVNNQQGGQF